MATLKDLREQMATIATEARSLLDQSSGEKNEARAAELEKQHDKAMSDYDALDVKAERVAKLEAMESRVTENTDRAEREAREAKRPGVDAVEANSGGAMDYRHAFWEYTKAQGDIGAMSSEARAVLETGYEARAQTSGTTTEGGYTVPTELSDMMTKTMLAWGPMYDPGITSEMVTSGGGTINLPTVDDTTTAIVKHVEGTTLTDDGGSDVVFGQKTLSAYGFNTEFIRVSKELVDDSIFAMESFLGELLGERMGRRANLELTTGDGTGDPNGIVTASALGATAAAVGAITWDEIIELEHSVNPAYRGGPRVRYMLNDSTLEAIRKLKNGSGDYIWQNGNVQAGIPQTINGRPFSINQAMASLGTGNKVMLFGDFGKYWVRKVGSPLVGAVQDKDFWPGFGMAGHIRFDGELLDTTAVKHLINA